MRKCIKTLRYWLVTKCYDRVRGRWSSGLCIKRYYGIIVGSSSTALSLVVGEASVTRKQVSRFGQPNIFMFFLHQIQGWRDFLMTDGKRMIIIMGFLDCIQENKAWQGRQVLGEEAVITRVRDCARLKPSSNIFSIGRSW
jgi:hypothetical protein